MFLYDFLILFCSAASIVGSNENSCTILGRVVDSFMAMIALMNHDGVPVM